MCLDVSACMTRRYAPGELAAGLRAEAAEREAERDRRVDDRRAELMSVGAYDLGPLALSYGIDPRAVLAETIARHEVAQAMTVEMLDAEEG